MSSYHNKNQTSHLVDRLLDDVASEQSPKFIKSSWGKSTRKLLDSNLTLFKVPQENQSKQIDPKNKDKQILSDKDNLDTTLQIR